MTSEEAQLNRQRLNRIRRVKRLLRPLPRRATVHRYPVLKWFAAMARRRSYLWSYKLQHVIPAFYTGSILALLPIYGIQIPLAFLLAVVMRGNLTIFVGLQFITNPATAIPIYYIQFQMGRLYLKLFGYETTELQLNEFRAILTDLWQGNWGHNIELVLGAWAMTTLGGISLGLLLGMALTMTYRIIAYRGARTIRRLKYLREERERRDRSREAEGGKPLRKRTFLTRSPFRSS